MSEKTKLGKEKEQEYRYASSSERVEFISHLVRRTPNKEVINGNYKSLGSAQGFDEQGTVDNRSAGSCALVSCLASMARICTGDFDPESMKAIIVKYVPTIWQAMTRLDILLRLGITSSSGYVEIDDLLKLLWPAHVGVRNQVEGGGNILSEITYQKLSKLLSEDDSLCELHFHAFRSLTCL